jgi:hypothetical protein
LSIYILPDGTIKVDTVGEALAVQQSKLDGIAKASEYQIEDPEPVTATVPEVVEPVQTSLDISVVTPVSSGNGNQRNAAKIPTLSEAERGIDIPERLAGFWTLIETYRYMAAHPNRLYTLDTIASHFRITKMAAEQRLATMARPWFKVVERPVRGYYKVILPENLDPNVEPIPEKKGKDNQAG